MNIDYSRISEIENQIIQLYKSLEKKAEDLNLALFEQKESYEKKIAILEKQIELDAELFKNLNMNIEKVTIENAYLKEHSVPISEYLAVVKLNEKLLFELLNKNYIEENKNEIHEAIQFINEEFPEVSKLSLEEKVELLTIDQWLSISNWIKTSGILSNNIPKRTRYINNINAQIDYKKKMKNPTPGEKQIAKDIYNFIVEKGFEI